MANTIRIKRRDAGSGAGAPASLENAELAFNEASLILYYGIGTGGAGGSATTIIPIAGNGAFVALSGDQTIGGTKTFSSTIAGSVSGNAGTATALQTGRTFSVSGDATGTSGSFDGTGNATIPLTLAVSGVTAGTYGNTTHVSQITVNAKGLVTGASNVAITFPVNTVNGQTGTVVLNTSHISEVTNLYYTDARVRLNRLDQMATPTANVSMGSVWITNLADPLNAQEAATKAYVDSVTAGAGNAPWASVRAISLSNITLSAPQTIDGVAVIAGERVLVAGQSTGADNGIYVVAAGAWTRATDADVSGEFLPGKQVFVNEGTDYADSTWSFINNAVPTLGSTSLSFTQINGLGQINAGDGLTKTLNTLNVGAGTGIVVNANDVALTGQALAFHNLATNGFVVRTGSGTVAGRTFANTAGITISNADGVSGAPSFGLVDSLSALAPLTPAADRIAYYTGATTAAIATLSSFSRGLLANTADSTWRSSLGLGTMATQAASSVAITGGTLDSVTITNTDFDGGTF